MTLWQRCTTLVSLVPTSQSLNSFIHKIFISHIPRYIRISLWIMSCLWTADHMQQTYHLWHFSGNTDLNGSKPAKQHYSERGPYTAEGTRWTRHHKHTLHTQNTIHSLQQIVHNYTSPITPIHQQQLSMHSSHSSHTAILTLHTTDIHHTQAHINTLTPHQRVIPTQPVADNGDERSSLWPVYHKPKQPNHPSGSASLQYIVI